MHEVIVDYEYRPVVAGINRINRHKMDGGGIIVKKKQLVGKCFGAG